jgi:hypothetical protein
MYSLERITATGSTAAAAGPASGAGVPPRLVSGTEPGLLESAMKCSLSRSVGQAANSWRFLR